MVCVGHLGCSGHEATGADGDGADDQAAQPDDDATQAGASGAAGAGPVPDPLAAGECWQATSGSRLQLISWVGEDGSWETNNQWFDSELQTRCSFVTAGDGETRCLPMNSSIYTDRRAYIDAECTESRPVFAPPVCFPGPEVRYYLDVQSNDDPDCPGSIFRLFELRASLGAIVPLYLSPQGEGSCTEFILSSEGEHEVFELGEEVPPESFVRVEGYESRGDRLQVPLELRSDGSTEFVVPDPYDITIGSRCDYGLATDGSVRCLPYYAGSVAYIDATCSERGAQDLSYQDACRDPDGIDLGAPFRPYARERLDVCGTTRVYELAPPEEALELDTLYSLDDSEPAMCIASPLTTPVRYLSLLEEAAPDQFALGSLELVDCGPIRSSGTRLQVIDVVWEGGYQNAQAFYDSELQQRCYSAPAADGTWRCLPGAATSIWNGQFLDEACTQEFARLPPRCSDSVDPFAGSDFVQLSVPALGEGPCGGSGFGVRRLVGPELELSLVYTLESDGSCTATPLSPPVLAREVGEEVPPETFVAFETSP